MKSEIHSDLHKHRRDRNMFLCSIFFFALSFVSASDDVSASEDDQQTFRCGRQRHNMCDEMDSLRTELDANTADRRKWNRHLQFVERFHRSWEVEVANVASRIVEGLSVAGDPKLTRKMDTLEAADLNLRSELEKEREARKKIENDLLNDNRHLRSEMVALQRKMDTLEAADLNLRSELEKEREARNKIENQVKEALSSLLASIPLNFSETLGDMRIILEGFDRKVESLESQGSETVDEVDKQRNNMKMLQSLLSQLRSVTLTVANILREDAAPRYGSRPDGALKLSMLDEIIKELNEPLDAASGDLEREILHTLPFRNFSTENSNSKAIDVMNSKLEELQFNMRILTDSMGKAMSKIKILENKYNEALRAQVRPNRRKRPEPDYELVEKHSKPDDRRPFDPRRDP